MSIKSLIQIVIIIIIFIIVGGVYYRYFLDNRVILEENTNQSIENTQLANNTESSKNTQLANNTQSSENDQSYEQTQLNENKKTEIDSLMNSKDQNLKNQNLIKDKDNINVEKTKKDVLSVNNTNLKSENKNKVIKKKEEETVVQNKKKQVDNLVKEVEYLTTDRNGNKYKIFADSGKTNQKNKNILDLVNVKGIISSGTRSNIYFVADFAEYNSSNQSSKFYQNVVITYDDKQITCDNFDIDMETNFAIAYSNVIVTDPKSIMKAGKITLDIETKDININPDNNQTKVKVVTN